MWTCLYICERISLGGMGRDGVVRLRACVVHVSMCVCVFVFVSVCVHACVYLHKYVSLRERKGETILAHIYSSALLFKKSKSFV